MSNTAIQVGEDIELPEILAQFRGYTADIAVVRRSRADAAFATLKGQSNFG
jgi:hypothetical protein